MSYLGVLGRKFLLEKYLKFLAVTSFTETLYDSQLLIIKWLITIIFCTEFFLKKEENITSMLI